MASTKPIRGTTRPVPYPSVRQQAAAVAGQRREPVSPEMKRRCIRDGCSFRVSGTEDSTRAALDAHRADAHPALHASITAAREKKEAYRQSREASRLRAAQSRSKRHAEKVEEDAPPAEVEDVRDPEEEPGLTPE